MECTTSVVAPVVDGLLTGYQLFRAGYAAQASEGDYASSPIPRETDLALGIGLSAAFLASAIYGGVSAARCQRLKSGPVPGEPEAPLVGVSP